MMMAPSSASGDTRLDHCDLEDLVRRSRAGDLEAFNEIVRRYYEITFRLAFRMLGERAAAEDATQEIFVKAWRNLRRFRGAARFSTWLHTIAVRQCLDAAKRRFRDASRSQPLIPENGFELEDLPAASPFNDRDLRLSIQEAIEKLPEKLKVVVTLHFFSDYSMAEVAAALDLHPNTIRQRLNQAIQRLKATLGDLEIR
jgi:RNA polymerase sigma-70 factor (ECF subfamily)